MVNVEISAKLSKHELPYSLILVFVKVLPYLKSSHFSRPTRIPPPYILRKDCPHKPVFSLYDYPETIRGHTIAKIIGQFVNKDHSFFTRQQGLPLGPLNLPFFSQIKHHKSYNVTILSSFTPVFHDSPRPHCAIKIHSQSHTPPTVPCIADGSLLF